MRTFCFYSHFNLILNFISVLLVFALFLILIQNNPVYSVFNFILVASIVFFILVLIGAEFFALLILIIYTGVITVLFLFVIIMYNLRSILFREMNSWLYVLFIIIIYKLTWLGQILLSVFGGNIVSGTNIILYSTDVTQFICLFNGYYIIFFFCGLLIFIAMFGSVVLTSSFFKYLK